MVNYNNGKIYKIEDLNGDMCYIGSTTKEYLSQRMTEHRRAYKCWKNGNTHNMSVFDIFEAHGMENSRIVLIETVPCMSKDELISREAHYIRTMACVNKVIPDRTHKEYLVDHKERIALHTKEYDLAYRINNQEQIAVRRKTYRDTNKELINKKSSRAITCECGVTHRIGDKARHRRTIHHVQFQQQDNPIILDV